LLGAGQQAPAARQEQAARVEPVTVPASDGAPVITDGVFTPGEWDDALKIAIADGVTMFLKVAPAGTAVPGREFREVVFVGVRGATGPADLCLAPVGGPILRLHVSCALGQVLVPLTGEGPKLRLGFTTDWYASELRRDEQAFQRMLEEGRSEREARQATTYPLEGLEFAIRRFKVPGRVWMMRLAASGVAANSGTIIYPPGAAPFDPAEGAPSAGRGAERTTDGWLELLFK
jgi:hypothetical protein